MVTAGPGVTNYGDRDGQCLARARAGAADRRLHVASAGEHGPAAGHPARRHPAAGHAHCRARCASPSRWCASSTKPCRAAMGDVGEPGPVYVEIPTDVLRTTVPPQLVLDEWMRPRSRRAFSRPIRPPSPSAVDAFWSAKRPLVITGRGARGAGRAWCACSTPPARSISIRRKAAASCRPIIRRSCGAVRAAAMSEADLVVLIGRKLDYQIGYGSPAVFPERALHPHRRHAGRADRQPARRAGAAGHAGARARRHGRGRRQPRAEHRQGLGRGTARRARGRAAAAAATTEPPTRRRRQDPSQRDLRCDPRKLPTPTTSPSPTAAIS